MKHHRVRFVLAAVAALFAGSACAGATRRVPLGQGLAVPAGERITNFPSDQRYRFVAPDSLVQGVTREDVNSVGEVMYLRSSVAVVLHSRGWRESEDSADYDITIFVSRRTAYRTEIREEMVVSTEASGLPRCDASRGGNQPRCTNDKDPRTRQVRVSVPVTVSLIHHVIRRRSDGAVRVWTHSPFDAIGAKAAVARDLMKSLLTPEA